MRIAVIGCGTGGPAAALLLARAGHDVEVLERAPVLGPVGAGILLQPTGMAVLDRLGLLEEVLAVGARVERLHGETDSGRVVMDLRYGDLEPGLFGLGVHRGDLFAALHRALEAEGIPVHTSREVRSRAELPEYDLVVAADGARSALRAEHPELVRRAKPYPWGAIWAIVEDPEARYAGTLAQVYRGTRRMLGFLPTGPGRVSLFWSHPTSEPEPTVAELKRLIEALTDRADPILARLETVLPARYHDVVMRRLHAPGIAFVGDAAHAMSPQLGQGANLALIDAACLADHVDDLPAYSAARRDHVRYYQWASRLMTPVFQSRLNVLGPPRDLLMHPAAKVPYLRRQSLLSLAGRKTGLFSQL